MDLNLETYDIYIAHRLGEKRWGARRPIIVKFLPRLKRDIVIRNQKLFKGSNIYINEDLTSLTQLVLACVRKKIPDEVAKVWSRNGRCNALGRSGCTDGDFLFNHVLAWALPIRTTTQKLYPWVLLNFPPCRGPGGSIPTENVASLVSSNCPLWEDRRGNTTRLPWVATRKPREGILEVESYWEFVLS